MAASQVECLEEDNGNMQVSECNPQFVYSERQRLALEALLDKGPGAFYQCIKREGTRLFLSAEEAHRLHASCGDFRHGKVPAGGDSAEAMVLDTDSSLTYWPTRSDAQAPFLTLGWPEMGMWKGITRAIVYTHPPMDNSPTIKEVIRSLLWKAKQVVAVVMDTFTDVDIFCDLVEGASLRQVPAYILLDQRNLLHFIAMAQGSGTNLQLLDNICVRVLNGSSFCSRNGKKVTGDVKERFLLVDGESVITGSYSFTWSDSRLDRNLVTLLTGQVVDAFDREFRTLYAASRPLQQTDFLPPPPQPTMVNGYNFPDVPGRPQALPASVKPSVLHRVVARRTVIPHPLPPSAGDAARPGARPTFRQTVTMWRGARGTQGAEAAQALSDILRRARQAASGPSAPPPKASKSMWDLSALSQLSSSGTVGSNSALDHLELGEDARSRVIKTQVTPAATLMKHRDALKDEELPSTPRNPRTFYPSRPPGLASHGNLRRPAPRPLGGPISTKTGNTRPAEK